MSIEKVYDKAVEFYDQELSSDLLTKTTKSAIEASIALELKPNHILGLGVGSGEQMLLYKKAYPDARISGLDISKQMLAQAEKVLACTSYHGSITEASRLISDKFDLIISHYVCAYVAPKVILTESQKLLSQDGMLSILTNTQGSFPNLMQLYQNFVASNSFIKRKIKKHVEDSLKTVLVPKSCDDLLKTLEENNYQTISDEQLNLEVTFETAEDFYNFFMKAGWFANGLVHPLMPEKLIKFFFNYLVKKHIAFPFTDKLDIALVLAKPNAKD